MLKNISRLARCTTFGSGPLNHFKHLNYGGSIFRKQFSSTETAKATATVISDTAAPAVGLSDHLHIKTQEFKTNEHCYVDEVDVGNVTSSVQPLDEANTSSIWEIISNLAPETIYETLDTFSRDVVLYLTHDMGLGMGWAIILASLGLRIFFAPLNMKAQLTGIKMKLLEPEMKNFQNLMQKLQRNGDMQGIKTARANFNALRERHGVSTLAPLMNLLQIPFMITWFFSLRYLANAPDKYPNIRTDGFLWFQDLSVNDPYFILPLISACISYYNIQMTLYNATSAGVSTFARYSRYMKYAPFVAMPFAVFFPAVLSSVFFICNNRKSLNLYWIVTAACQLILSAVARSQKFRSFMGIPQYLPGTILEKLHGVKKPDIIKAVVVDTPPVQAEAEQIKATHDAKAQPVTHAKIVDTGDKSGGKTVEILTQRPKVKKDKKN